MSNAECGMYILRIKRHRGQIVALEIYERVGLSITDSFRISAGDLSSFYRLTLEPSGQLIVTFDPFQAGAIRHIEWYEEKFVFADFSALIDKVGELSLANCYETWLAQRV